MLKKGKIPENFGRKCAKFENVLKRSRWLDAIIARNKLVEWTLTTHFTLLVLIFTRV